MNVRIRDVNLNDWKTILEMNLGSVQVLSPLDEARLSQLANWASYFRVVEKADDIQAFIIAMTEGSGYDSPNYRWFADRYERFLYIDRVVVKDNARGLGLGSALYRELHDHAHSLEIPWLTCEIDIDPPNPVSLEFHRKLGFEEVGKHCVPGRGKTVSLQAKNLKQTDRWFNNVRFQGREQLSVIPWDQ